ncbi:MAG: DUF167 domain-containing protein [Acidimicrobiales bacterium]|nr:DUF167 domain-containing protein [Acidimicrobiales bacterium]
MPRHQGPDASRVDDPQEIDIPLWVQPGASRTLVGGRHGEALRVAVAAPPERGRANAAVVDALAAALGLAARDVELVSGQRGRAKRALVRTADPDGLARQLDHLRGA